MDPSRRQPAFWPAALAVLVLSACAAGDAPSFACAGDPREPAQFTAAKDRDSLGQRVSRSSDDQRELRSAPDRGGGDALAGGSCSFNPSARFVSSVPCRPRASAARATLSFAQLPQPPPAA